MTAGPRELPALETNRELVLPSDAERTLANGLTVIAIERAACRWSSCGCAYRWSVASWTCRSWPGPPC